MNPPTIDTNQHRTASLVPLHGSRSSRDQNVRGFALVLALSLMAFILLLLLSLTTLVRVETKSSANALNRLAARESAQMGMLVALGQLQKAAGPDTRVTARASILGHAENAYTRGVDPDPERASWTGVWRSSAVPVPGEGRAYDPSQPNERDFVGWLVSGSDTAGNLAIPNQLEAAGSGPRTAGETVTLARQSDGAPSLQVEKVRIPNAGGSQAYFGFAVQDRGVAVDLEWSEVDPAQTGAERAEKFRLKVAPGPDYGIGDGVFASSLTYPLSRFSGQTGVNSFSRIVSKEQALLAILELDSGAFSSGSADEWLRDWGPLFTHGNFGVLSDNKWGGLRRDLSLAFEMDGEADTTSNEQPAKFNRQIGEFVGGTDRLAAPKTAIGMPLAARHLFRDTSGLGASEATPFSNDIVASHSDPTREKPVLRGPTWWALRDFANLYKRLRSTAGGGLALDARAYYPNRSALQNQNFGRTYSWGTLAARPNTNRGGVWDQEVAIRGQINAQIPTDYLFPLARANYAPVLLGGACSFSVMVVNERPDPTNGTTVGELALGIDPFFYLWNPYNRELLVERFGIFLDNGFPGHITFWKNYGEADEEQIGPRTMRDYLIAEETENRSTLRNDQEVTYLVKDLRLKPGEVRIVSPSSMTTATSRLHDEAFPGVNIDNNSGIVVDWIPKVVSGQGLNQRLRGEKISVVTDGGPDDEPVDEISYLYSNEMNASIRNSIYATRAFVIDTSMPDAGAEAGDLKYDANFRVGAIGDHVQTIGADTSLDVESTNAGTREFYEPPLGSGIEPVGSVFGDQLGNGASGPKQFFGLVTYLAKPANSGAPRARPVELVSQFNPAPLATYREMSRASMLNQAFQSISEPNNIGQLLQTAGIDFPAIQADRGFWGKSYGSFGQTAVPLKGIPDAPLLSLAQFRNANWGIRASEPFRPVGNSHASLFVSPDSPYGTLGGMLPNWGAITASDTLWLTNDALFDRYYFSGLAPQFRISASGYVPEGTLSATIAEFYGSDFREAEANPVLKPYFPNGKESSEIIAELTADDGYRKLAAYAMVAGAFNINSTFVEAWEALLRANRELPVRYAGNGATDNGSGTPFPKYPAPSNENNGAAPLWAGLNRLTDTEIRRLAEEIVEQVRIRGPFMSLSDFVNHRVGQPVAAETHFAGALQAAIDQSGINDTVRNNAGGSEPAYNVLQQFLAADSVDEVDRRKTSTGIAQDLTQADLLLPLAPRINARSDTFTIRAYGEIRSPTTDEIEARAICEAVVQRVPEYVDSSSNEPWDEARDPLAPQANSSLTAINNQFGRQFVVVDFRWLNPDEI